MQAGGFCCAVGVPGVRWAAGPETSNTQIEVVGTTGEMPQTPDRDSRR